MPFICNEHNLFFQGQCDSPFDLAALQKALKPTMFEKWLKAIQASEMEKVWFWQLTESFLFVLSCSEICLCKLSVLKKLRGEGCVSDQTSGMPPKKAGLEGLENCPFCPYSTIMDTSPEEDKVFVCRNPDCGKDSCRLCQEPTHIPQAGLSQCFFYQSKKNAFRFRKLHLFKKQAVF